MSRIIGLDFGTTNTRILLGYSDRPDQIAPIDLPESDRGSLPTVILIDDQGTLQQLGRSAEDALREPTQREWVRYEFKPCLGRSDEDLSVQSAGPALQLQCPDCGAKIPEGFRFCGECGKPLPEDYREKIAERSLRYERDEAFTYAGLLLEKVGSLVRQRTLGGSWEAGDVLVVGVPVHWGEATREQYADLLRRSFGSELVKVIDEPHAALAEYLSRAGGQVKPGDTVLVIDVGGGTTDLVAGVVQADGTLNQIKRHGIRFGGADFDDAVVQWAMGQLSRPPEISEDQLAGGLRPQCRELKEQLSDAVRTGLQGDNPQRRKLVVVPPVTGELVLDRTTFESDAVAGPRLSYLSASLTDSLRQMGLRAEDLNHLLLIGGGSNAYFVEDKARELFPQAKIVTGQQPEMAISRGLVITVAGLPVPRGREKSPDAGPPESITESGPAEPETAVAHQVDSTPTIESPLATLTQEIEGLMVEKRWLDTVTLISQQPGVVRTQPQILTWQLYCFHKLGASKDLLKAARGHENDSRDIAALVQRAKIKVAKAQIVETRDEGAYAYCQRCGTSNTRDTRFCRSCGSQLGMVGGSTAGGRSAPRASQAPASRPVSPPAQTPSPPSQPPPPPPGGSVPVPLGNTTAVSPATPPPPAPMAQPAPPSVSQPASAPPPPPPSGTAPPPSPAATPATSEADWLLEITRGSVSGPYSAATIAEWLRTGQLPKEARATRTRGRQAWRPLYQIAEFRDAAEQQTHQSVHPSGAPASQSMSPPATQMPSAPPPSSGKAPPPPPPPSSQPTTTLVVSEAEWYILDAQKHMNGPYPAAIIRQWLRGGQLSWEARADRASRRQGWRPLYKIWEFRDAPGLNPPRR